MAGVNTILRIIGAVLALFVIIFIAGIGVQLTEPISQALGAPPSGLGWAQLDMLMMMGLGLIGLSLVVIIWLIAAPIRNDVRQEQRPPRI